MELTSVQEWSPSFKNGVFYCWVGLHVHMYTLLHADIYAMAHRNRQELPQGTSMMEVPKEADLSVTQSQNKS